MTVQTGDVTQSYTWVLRNDRCKSGCYVMTVHTLVLHNILGDFFFLRDFFFPSGIFFLENLHILMIFVPISVRKGHFYPMELQHRQVDQ